MNWRLHAIGCIAVALLTHGLAIWAAPRLIMHGVGIKLSSLDTAGASGTPVHAPPVNAQSRTVVMPSPDLLYSLCRFDVSQGPLQITANPSLSTYWSIALYAANSDNFYVRNDRQFQAAPVHLTLASRYSSLAGQPGVVLAPTDTGLLLMRVLTGHYESEKSTLEPARRSLKCTPLQSPSF